MLDRLQATPSDPQAMVLRPEDAESITAAAHEYNLDPCHLLGLLLTESASLNAYAERWGDWSLSHVLDAIGAYERGVTGAGERLQGIVDGAWPDISFGRSQSIVAYHPRFLAGIPEERYTPETLHYWQTGDPREQIKAVARFQHVLELRAWAFTNPDHDLRLAAQKFAGCMERAGGDPLAACIIYNAGSDRRGDPEWMAKYSHHVDRYRENLELAEAYRLRGADTSRMARALGGLYGIGNLLAGLAPDRQSEQHHYVLALKEEINRLLPEGERIP